MSMLALTRVDGVTIYVNLAQVNWIEDLVPPQKTKRGFDIVKMYIGPTAMDVLTENKAEFPRRIAEHSKLEGLHSRALPPD